MKVQTSEYKNSVVNPPSQSDLDTVKLKDDENFNGSEVDKEDLGISEISLHDSNGNPDDSAASDHVEISLTEDEDPSSSSVGKDQDPKGGLSSLCVLAKDALAKDTPIVGNIQGLDPKAEEEVLKQLVTSAWCGLLAALSTLLEACTDEAATESILQSFQTLAWVSGVLDLPTPRDAFITSLCKSCLPPHYTLTVLNTPNNSPNTNNNSNRTPQQQQQPLHQQYYDSEMRHQVVAVGSALPTSSSPSGAQQGPVMLTNKNLQVMRAVLSLAHCHGAVLGTAWHLVLTTLQHLVWVLGLKPAAGGSLKVSLFFFFLVTLFLRKLYLKNFIIKNKDNKIMFYFFFLNYISHVSHVR